MVRPILPKSIWALALAALAGCARPGSERMTYDEARGPNRAKILFDRRCSHIKNPTEAELKEYEVGINRMNPDILDQPFRKALGVNVVPPPCPMRIRTCPDQGVLRCPDSGVTKTKTITHPRRIHRPRSRKPDAGPSGVIIKP